VRSGTIAAVAFGDVQDDALLAFATVLLIFGVEQMPELPGPPGS
jgi:hypothetical protein